MRFPRFFSRSNKGSCRSSSRDGFRRKMDGRRLRFEPLEVRQLLSVDLYGTAGHDTVTMELDQNETHILVTVNGGQPTSYDADVDIIFHGNGGDDTAYLYGSSGNDTLTGYATSTSVELSTGGSYTVDDDFLHVNTYGEGGTDTACLYDSTGDDAFVAGPALARMSYASGTTRQATDFDEVYANASNGGADTATLYGSAGDDAFAAYEQYGFMMGTGYYNVANGFGEVAGNAAVNSATFGAATGGTDSACLYDSEGEDVFEGDSQQASMSRDESSYSVAIGFYAYCGWSSGQAGDVAKFYGSTGDDAFYGHNLDSFFDDGNPVVVHSSCQQFALVQADFTGTQGGEAGGVDIAYFYGDDGPDTFTLDIQNAVMVRHAGNRAEATGFDYACAFGQSDDQAVLCGAVGNDTFYGHDAGASCYLRDGQKVIYGYVESFGAVTADVTGSSGGTSGGTDDAYLYDTDGDDTLTADPDQATIAFSTGTTAQAVGFTTGTATATAHDDADSATLFGDTPWTLTGDWESVFEYPLLDPIDDMTIDEDATLQTVNLSRIAAVGGALDHLLEVSATSSNPDLIPTPSVSYTSPSTTGSISFTPAAGEIGTSTITVTVRDAGPDDTFDTGDDTTFSREFTVTVLPAAPTNLAATIDDGSQASLTWDDNSANEFAYCVEQSIGGGWYAVAWADADAESATVSGVFQPGVQYAFRVKAYVYDAWSNPSNEATDTAGAWPAAPSGLVLDVVSTTAIDLTWSDNATNETSYLVARSTDGETWSTVDDTLDPDATSFSDSGLDSGTRYHYRVQAVNAVGGSGYAACEAVTPPYAPTDFEGTVVSGTQIDLSWTASADATGYTISVRPDGASAWSVLDTVSAQATSYPATGLEAGGAYYMFCVAPTNSDGTSANAYTGWLQTQNAAPTIATAPAAAASPVTATSTTLTVLGADDGGEENLIYLWSLDSCPEGEDAWFGTNGTNAAQETTVTFSAAGQYAFKVTVTDACGQALTSDTLNVEVAETFSTIEVTPGVVGVLFDKTQQFSAKALDQFGHEMTTPPTFTWALDGLQVGTLNASSGLYTAPVEGEYHYGEDASFDVTASAGGLVGSADVGYLAPRLVMHSFYLEAEGDPTQEFSLSDYGIDDHIFRFTVFSDYTPWYDDISFTGADPIDFEVDDLEDGDPPVWDYYEDEGVLFEDRGEVLDLDPPDGNRVYVPGDEHYEITAKFPETSSGVSFTMGGMLTQTPLPSPYARLFVDEAVAQLVALTVTDAENPKNWATDVVWVTGTPQLYVPEVLASHTAEIDIEPLLWPSGLDDVVRVVVDRDGTADGGDVVQTATLTGGGTTSATLPVTDTERHFVVTAWHDLNNDNVWDANERSLAVNVDVVNPLPDIDTDSDNNGQIISCMDDPTADPLFEEAAPGRILPWNNNDSDRNGIADRDEAPVSAPEPDLWPAELHAEVFGGVLELSDYPVELTQGSDLKLYLTQDKKALPTDLTVATMPQRIWVEGYDVGQDDVTMILKTPTGKEVGRDKVKFTVINVDIDTDSNNTGPIEGTLAEDNVEADVPGQSPVPGKIVLLNSDDDNDDHIRDYGANQRGFIDDDLVEVVLRELGSLGGMAGYTLVLDAGPGVQIWGSQKKDPFVAMPCEVFGKEYRYTIPAGGGNLPQPISFYVEGMATLPSNVSWRLESPSGATVFGDVVKFSVVDVYVDVDTDSDNANGLERSVHEDQIENDAAEPGKFVLLGTRVAVVLQNESFKIGSGSLTATLNKSGPITVWDSALGGNVVTSVTPGSTTTVWVEGTATGAASLEMIVTSAAPSLPPRSDKVKFTVVDVCLFSIDYNATDLNRFHEITHDPAPAGAYDDIEWQDNNHDGDADDAAAGDHKWPVCYTRSGTTHGDVHVKVDKVKIRKWGNVGTNVKVRASGMVGAKGIALPATAAQVAGDYIEATLESQDAIPSAIKSDTIDFDWELSLDGGATWINVGESHNTAYLTWDDPDPSLTPLYETCVYIGCEAADGVGGDVTVQNDRNTTVTTIYSNGFASRSVHRVDGTLMIYNHDIDTALTAAQMLGNTTGKGQCTAWADLFVQVLGVQGLAATSTRIDPGMAYLAFCTRLMPAQGSGGADYVPGTFAATPPGFAFHQVVRVAGLQTRSSTPHTDRVLTSRTPESSN